jgi:hypothetical protein
MRLLVTVVLMFAGPLDEPPTASSYVLVDAALNGRALVGTRVLKLQSCPWGTCSPCGSLA